MVGMVWLYTFQRMEGLNTMANRKDTAKAKAAMNAATIKANERSKVVAETVAKKKEEDKAKAVLAVVNNEVEVDDTGQVAGVTDSPVTRPATSAGRYRTTGAAHGFELAEGLSADIKPEFASYNVKLAHTQFASNFYADEEASVVTAINTLSTDLEDLQGKLSCACAGLAYRLMDKGIESFHLVEKFLTACEPLGKTLSAVRVNAMRLWFIDFAPITLKSVEGQGKILQFDIDKWQKEKAKFSNDKIAWLRRRIAKPFFLVKPEPKLGEFVLEVEMQKLLKRAATMQGNANDPEKAKKFAVIDMHGYAEFIRLANAFQKAAKAERALEEAQAEIGDTEEDQTAEEQANAA